MEKFPAEQNGAAVVGEVIAIPIDQIDMGERLRPVDEEWAAQLGRVMLREGQRTPIEVCRLPGQSRYLLVAGAHRMAAAEIYRELSPIRAIVVSNDKSERKLAEISENIWRKGLNPVDRAAFVAELITVLKAQRGLSPEQDGRSAIATPRELSKDAAEQSAIVAQSYDFSEEAADRLALSARTIKYDLMLHRQLQPSEIERLRRANHPALNKASELKALAKLNAVEQSIVVSLLLYANMKIRGAPFDKVGDAIAAHHGRAKPSAEAKRQSAFLGAFDRMSAGEKRGVLMLLAERLPKGWTLEGPQS